MLASNIERRFWEAGISTLVASLVMGIDTQKVMSAEKVIVNYGVISQSVELEELKTFAETGEASGGINFLLKASNQNPYAIRWILTQQFPANNTLIYDLLNTAPGEYVLSQTSQVVNSKSERANVKALRGAIVASTSDDNLVSLLELLENYPTKEVYINSKVLAKANRNLSQFIQQINRYIKIPFDLLKN
ncbi:salt-induced periplasmic protein [Chondrocystis sp. NIES-4102]|nr:salt-induced periplasmic protein [Chondrocystis sp. NIES-4102]